MNLLPKKISTLWARFTKEEPRNIEDYRLSDEEQELLIALHTSGRPHQEIAASMYKSEARIRYEIGRLGNTVVTAVTKSE